MPAPMARYSQTTYEREYRNNVIREHLPMIVFVGLLALWGVTACSLVTARHRIAQLEAACQSR